MQPGVQLMASGTMARLALAAVVAAVAWCGGSPAAADEPLPVEEVLRRLGGGDAGVAAPADEGEGEGFADGRFDLRPGEVVVFAGGENFVREQAAGAFESRLVAGFADRAPRVRWMAWEGDTVYLQRRHLNFGSWEDQLAAVGAGVVVAQFGQLEALDGRARIPEFVAEYTRLVDAFARQTGRIVLVSPMPFERPLAPGAPDLRERNGDVAAYSEAVRQVAERSGSVFVDLFSALSEGGSEGRRLTAADGIHLSAAGLEVVGEEMAEALGVPRPAVGVGDDLAEAIVEKNRLWFDAWRPMNWAFAFGDRTAQAFGTPSGDHPWLREEVEQLADLVAAEEERVFRIARGEPVGARLEPPGSGAAPGPDSDPGAALAAMEVADGFRVNLFAGEADGVANPVQIAWDAAGRLYVACSPTYPHIVPGQRPGDYILVCEDSDGDGVADRCGRFAEGLHMVQGVEPGRGGVYVCAGTQVLHLRDTDGDLRADEWEVVLSGFGTGDAHQLANSISRGPDGFFWFTQGLHVESVVETPRGLSSLQKAGVWRWSPRTLALEGFFNGGKAGHNCWGVGFDDAHQAFHKTGDRPHGYYLTPGMIRLDDPAEYHPTGALFEAPIKTTSLDFIGTPHFPDELQGCAAVAGFMGNTVDLYRLRDDGSGFRSERLPELVRSRDEEFRPVDVSMGPDGALYVCDFHNRLIGHYQASYRDPGRDHAHGRIWRVAAVGREVRVPPTLAGAAPGALVGHLASRDRWVRHRAKVLLFDGDRDEVVAACRAALAEAGEAAPEIAMEVGGVFRAHGLAEPLVLQALGGSRDARQRAYGARLAAAWAEGPPEALELLRRSARDRSPRVRLEALVGAVALDPDTAFGVVREVFGRPRDRFLDYALTNAARALRPHWARLAAAGELAGDAALLEFLTGAAGDVDRPDPPGKLIYDSLCSNCHQPDGMGLPGIYPPLGGSGLTLGEPAPLIRVVLHGMAGRLERRGETYDSVMPPSGLDDRQLADVLTYIRSQFGNSAAPVEDAEVANERGLHRGRALPWTPDELGL